MVGQQKSFWVQLSKNFLVKSPENNHLLKTQLFKAHNAILSRHALLNFLCRSFVVNFTLPQ
jgi:hypothetical protein